MRILAVTAIVATAVLVAVLVWSAPQQRGERPTTPVHEVTTLPTTGAPTITGTVLRGGPVADADVTLWRGEPRRPLHKEWLREDPLDELNTPRHSTALATTRADADGNFTFDVPPGDYVVVARAPDGGAGSRPLHLHDTAAVEIVVAARGHALEGVVQHADGNPARGFVRAHLLNGPLAWVATDLRGRFTLEDLPGGVISLEALAPGAFRITEHGIAVPHDGTVVLSAGKTFPITLRGRVVAFTNDQPITGARIVLHQAPDLVATRTGEDGSFALPGATVWTDVWIHADGYAPYYTRCIPEQAPIYRLLRPATVTGVVLAEDRSLAGATVELRDVTGMRTTTTSADGRFAIQGVAPGEVFYFARASGWLPENAARHSVWHWSRHNPFSLTLGPESTASVEIRMEPTVHLEGVVLSADGAPAVDARVRAGWGDAAAIFTRTGDNGRFRVEAMPARSHHVYAEADGATGSARGPGPFEIRLTPARTCRVVVEAGGPVEGARIESVDENLVRGVWWTAADGAVEIHPPESVWQLRVSAEGFVPEYGEAEGGEVRFTLKPARVVRVQVRFPDGRPAPGIGLYSGYTRARTGRDGWTSLGPIPKERVRVQASHEGWLADAMIEKEETILVLKEPDREELKFDFRLRIVDELGHPVPAGRVRLDAKLKQEPPVMRSTRRVKFPFVSTFADGVYELSSTWFPVDDENRVTIDVMAAQTPGFSIGIGRTDGTPIPLGPATIGPIPFFGEHEIVLPAERRLRGRVVDEGGAPVASALVWAWPAGGTPGRRPIKDNAAYYDRTRTRQDGAFELGRLGAGRVALVVEPPRGFLPSGVVDAAPDDDVKIMLARGARPVVTVTDTAGKPLAGARVQVRFPSWDEPFDEKRPGFWAEDDDWSWRTNEKGEVRLGGLEAEREYRLRVTPPAGHRLAPEERHRWKPQNTTVPLGPATTITGVVRDSRGRPRGEVYLHAQFENGDGTIVDVGSNGTFKVDKVPVGKVTFNASIDGRDHGIDSKSEPVVVTAGASDVVVLIDRPPSVLLRIVDWDPDGLTTVYLNDGDSNWPQGHVQDDGRLEIVGVDPKKKWRTMIGPTPDGRYALLEDIVPSQEVRTVRLVQGGEIRGRIHLPEKYNRLYLRVAHPVINAYKEIADDGSFAMRGLPPGRWNIAVSIQTPDGTLTAEAEASPGDTVDLTPE